MQNFIVAELNIKGSTDHDIDGRIRQNDHTIFSVTESIVGKLRNVIMLRELIPYLEG